MEEIIVKRSEKLNGTVKVDGGKNSVLPILAASLLPSKGITELKNVPFLSDVDVIGEILRSIGVKITKNRVEKSFTIDATGEQSTFAPENLVSKLRGSIVVAGAILARNGKVQISNPGGDLIGKRPIDIHLKGFEQLGAKVATRGNYIVIEAQKGLTGSTIYMDYPSVGATQNLLLAATLAEGQTILVNAAMEPEIVDLANYLNKMGAKISGAGTGTIVIEGVNELTGVEYEVMPDRIETGTFMILSAITKGDIFIENGVYNDNIALISKLNEMGVKITKQGLGIRVIGPETLQPSEIKTLPFPGFPTDLQALMTVAQAKADGMSVMTETVFDNRFAHIDEFRRMGVSTHVIGTTAIIRGAQKMYGANVSGGDVRAIPTLILAGLISEGITRVRGTQHMHRGYVNFVGKLKSLGANIQSVEV